MQDDPLIPPRADLSILGLGAMGSAVASRLLASGLRIAVWNRSPQKADPLVAKGAEAVATAEEALLAAPITLVILSDAKVACDVLGAVRTNLSGRTVVNYSSGTTADVLAFRDLAGNARCRYLRGAITSYPRNVGHQDSCYFYSGDLDAFEAHRVILDRLSGGALFLSAADAAALGTAVTIQSFVAMGGFYEAVAAGTRLGAATDGLVTNLIRVSRFLLLDAIDDAAQRLAHNNFGGEQATIDTHIVHIESLIASLSEHGIATPLLDAFLATARRASVLGYGLEDIAATSKALAQKLPDWKGEIRL